MNEWNDECEMRKESVQLSIKSNEECNNADGDCSEMCESEILLEYNDWKKD